MGKIATLSGCDLGRLLLAEVVEKVSELRTAVPWDVIGDGLSHRFSCRECFCADFLFPVHV